MGIFRTLLVLWMVPESAAESEKKKVGRMVYWKERQKEGKMVHWRVKQMVLGMVPE